LNSFDSTILHYVNQFAFRVPAFDKSVVALTSMYATRGLVLMAMLWWIWSRDGASARRDREIMVATVAAGFVALILGRVLAEWLPFRMRPLANPALSLHFPTAGDEAIRSWSAFPSDHAMLWCAIATGIFLASRRLGALALAFAIVCICLPRVYVGLHHPTDVIAGGVLGALVCVVLCRPRPRQIIAGPILALSSRFPGPIHAAIFILSFEMVTQFEELRRLSAAILK
jgi:undecaprenyl-diphosphatase